MLLAQFKNHPRRLFRPIYIIHTCQPKLDPSSDPVPLTFDPDAVQRGTGGDPGAGGALAAQCPHGQGGGGPGNTRLNPSASKLAMSSAPYT
jgi:hypothetical protein